MTDISTSFPALAISPCCPPRSPPFPTLSISRLTFFSRIPEVSAVSMVLSPSINVMSTYLPALATSSPAFSFRISLLSTVCFSITVMSTSFPAFELRFFLQDFGSLADVQGGNLLDDRNIDLFSAVGYPEVHFLLQAFRTLSGRSALQGASCPRAMHARPSLRGNHVVKRRTLAVRYRDFSVRRLTAPGLPKPQPAKKTITMENILTSATRYTDPATARYPTSRTSSSSFSRQSRPPLAPA